MKELYVVNCCRTAVGSFGGSLKNTPAAELGAIVVKEAISFEVPGQGVSTVLGNIGNPINGESHC